ncbi:MAG: DUF3108 domain-containing protein [bacterium]
MKGKRIARIGLVFYFFLLLVAAGKGEKIQPFKPGEKLTYRVKIFGLPVGEETLEIKDAVQIDGYLTYPLFWRVRIIDPFSLLYHFDYTIESFVDVNTLYPRLVRFHFEEGSRIKDREIRLDQAEGIALIKDWRGEFKREFSVPAMDTVSLIYWLRAQDLRVGKSFSLSLIEGRNPRKIEIKVLRKEEVTTYSGNYSAFLCSEVASDKTEVKLWISDDERHLPVKFQAETSIGTLTAYLVSIESADQGVD